MTHPSRARMSARVARIWGSTEPNRPASNVSDGRPSCAPSRSGDRDRSRSTSRTQFPVQHDHHITQIWRILLDQPAAGSHMDGSTDLVECNLVPSGQ